MNLLQRRNTIAQTHAQRLSRLQLDSLQLHIHLAELRLPTQSLRRLQRSTHRRRPIDQRLRLHRSRPKHRQRLADIQPRHRQLRLRLVVAISRVCPEASSFAPTSVEFAVK